LLDHLTEIWYGEYTFLYLNEFPWGLQAILQVVCPHDDCDGGLHASSLYATPQTRSMIATLERP